MFLLHKIKEAFKSVFRDECYIRLSTKEILKNLIKKDKYQFLSVGANDGMKNDPLVEFIKEYKWEGIMIEPLPANFLKLKRNYSNFDKIQLLNVGIAAEDSKMPLYYIDDVQENEPDWYDQVASFDYTTFQKNIEEIPEVQSRIKNIDIETVTFETLFKKYAHVPIEILMIDTEGYDYKILKTFPFKIQKPNIIIFEYDWITNYEFREAKKLLRKNGYAILYNQLDCIAFIK